ncbi:MAG: hypothetical protein KatS3mg057_2966 [Herpetosiphonaceae bacterium]|nr:MAG: hypothetical protein KatS3mg057_2966 [Herpetosiphonaceae bacterium]
MPGPTNCFARRNQPEGLDRWVAGADDCPLARGRPHQSIGWFGGAQPRDRPLLQLCYIGGPQAVDPISRSGGLAGRSPATAPCFSFVTLVVPEPSAPSVDRVVWRGAAPPPPPASALLHWWSPSRRPHQSIGWFGGAQPRHRPLLQLCYIGGPRAVGPISRSGGLAGRSPAPALCVSMGTVVVHACEMAYNRRGCRCENCRTSRR